VDGVLNGASTAVITSRNQANATSSDVFVTNGGNMLTATGVVTLTPVPGKPPGEFTLNVVLTLTVGSGKYAGTYGWITFEGQGHNAFGGPGPSRKSEMGNFVRVRLAVPCPELLLIKRRTS
jgi:hypothetical protein